MSLLIWALVGIVVGFALAALASRKFHHRIAPVVLLLAFIAALGVAHWAYEHPGHAMLQAQAFIVSCGLLGSVAGSLGWLIFARLRWAMIASAVISLALVVALPIVVPFLAHAAAGL